MSITGLFCPDLFMKVGDVWLVVNKNSRDWYVGFLILRCVLPQAVGYGITDKLIEFNEKRTQRNSLRHILYINRSFPLQSHLRCTQMYDLIRVIRFWNLEGGLSVKSFFRITV